MKNVLITSISKKVPLIKEVRKAALRVNSYTRIIGADSNDNAVGQHFVDQFWVMPLLKNLSIEQLINYCIENQITHIIPTRDGELLYFSKMIDKLSEVGIHVMISPIDSIEMCLDKLSFYEKGLEFNHSTIPTALNIDSLEIDRFVVKERFGAGADKIGLNLSKLDAVDWSKQLNHPIFQPYLEGKEISVDVYLSKNGFAKGCIARTRDVVVDGESQVTTAIRHDKVENECISFAESLHLYGHVIFQVLVDERENIYFIECNSRFGGASRLSIEMGLDSFYWFFLETIGHDLSQYPFQRLESNKKLIRYAEDLII